MRTLILVVVASLLLPLAGAHHREDHGTSTVPDMPTEATFGLCTAWAHNENGREHGNAGNAGPFVWLQNQADAEDQTVEEYCAEHAPHPGLA